jgi:hypothetical protein
MTGKPDFNFPAFNAAADKLRDVGWDVINPAESFGGRTDLPRSAYMRKDIGDLLRCDYVGCLPGWEDSKGASLEVQIAKELGLPIFNIETEERIAYGESVVAR